MPYVALAGLVISGVMAAKSASDKKKAESKLSGLKHTNYTVSPELREAYNRAQGMARFGFSPSEKAAFRQNVAQDINTQSQRALDIGGGNLAKTISRMGQISNLGAENQFAAQDAALKRQNIQQANALAGQVQGQLNLGTGEGINQYNRASQEYGQAAAQQQENIYSALGNLIGFGGMAQEGFMNQSQRQAGGDPNVMREGRNITTPQSNRAFYAPQGQPQNADYYSSPMTDYYRFGL